MNENDKALQKERLTKQYENLEKMTKERLQQKYPLRLKLCHLLILWNFRQLLRRL